MKASAKNNDELWPAAEMIQKVPQNIPASFAAVIELPK